MIRARFMPVRALRGKVVRCPEERNGKEGLRMSCKSNPQKACCSVRCDSAFNGCRMIVSFFG